MAHTISVTRVSKSRLTEELRENSPFGTNYSDHMFVADYRNGKWQDARVVPYGPMSLSPALTALHYGQSLFEGFKAHRMPDAKVALFRPMANHARLNRSRFATGDAGSPGNSVPGRLVGANSHRSGLGSYREGGSLYVRPVYFGTDESLMVRPAESYRLVIFTAPGGPYFAQPIRLLAEQTYVRAFPGGTGDAKSAGNYGGGLLAAKLAQGKGFHNVMWLDGKDRRLAEESGVMNIAFVIKGVVVTPSLSGTILPGVTRDSVLTLLREMNFPHEERAITVEEVVAAHANGTLEEAFGIGTAAVIAPIAAIGYRGRGNYRANGGGRRDCQAADTKLVAIQTGKEADTHGWLLHV